MIKESATKYIKLIREGKLSDAAIAKIVKTHGKEKFVKELGRGAEGVADVVLSPRFEKGIGVRKAYDPKGQFFTNRLFLKKHKIWKAVGDTPSYAKYYGKHEKAPITYHELVKGETGVNPKAGAKAIGRAWLRGKRVGDVLVHPDNIIGGKVVDFLPRGAEIYETKIMKGRGKMLRKMMRGSMPSNMLGGNLPDTKNIRTRAFKHTVKKEKVSPTLLYHKAKIPALAAAGTALMTKDKWMPKTALMYQ